MGTQLAKLSVALRWRASMSQRVAEEEKTSLAIWEIVVSQSAASDAGMT